jgi:hypothetical protein
MFLVVAILNYLVELELGHSQWEFLKYLIENFRRKPGIEPGISVQQAEAISNTPWSITSTLICIILLPFET